MATIKPGDVVSYYPAVDDLQGGLPLELFKRNCTTLLNNRPSGFYKFPPRAADKAGILSALSLLNVPEPFQTDEFAKVGWPLRLELDRTACPWGPHSRVQVTFDTSYNEGISPSNFVVAPDTHDSANWNLNSTLTQGITSGTPPGNFAYLGGGVPWNVDVVLEPVLNPDGCDYGIRVTATLTSTNYDFLSGSTAVQVADVSCQNFKDGVGIPFAWVAVKFNPGDPIGLVRSMSLAVRGSTVYP